MTKGVPPARTPRSHQTRPQDRIHKHFAHRGYSEWWHMFRRSSPARSARGRSCACSTRRTIQPATVRPLVRRVLTVGKGLSGEGAAGTRSRVLTVMPRAARRHQRMRAFMNAFVAQLRSTCSRGCAVSTTCSASRMKYGAGTGLDLRRDLHLYRDCPLGERSFCTCLHVPTLEAIQSHAHARRRIAEHRRSMRACGACGGSAPYP